MRKLLILSFIVWAGFNGSLYGQITYVNTLTGLYRITGGPGSCTYVPVTNECGGVDADLLSIALYKDTLYYSTYSGKLKRFVPGVAGSCELLLSNLAQYNSMTVDKNGILYMSGADLVRLNPHTFELSVVGPMPIWSNGDLIFFQDKLLLAGFEPISNTTGIFEININNPSASKLYIPTGSFIGMMSYPVPCTQSRYFGLSNNGGGKTDLVELDLLNKKVAGHVCSIPLDVLDGASSTEMGLDYDVYITDIDIIAPCLNTGKGSAQVKGFYTDPGVITYTLDNNITNTTGIFADLAPGQHTVRVTAPNGVCKKDSTFSIIPGEKLITGVTKTYPDICGATNSGSITVLTSSANLPMQYTLLTSGITQPTGDFTGLSKGVYHFRVIDAAGCSKDTIVDLSDGPSKFTRSIAVSPAFCNMNNGEIKINLNVDPGGAVSSIDNGPFTSALQYTNLAPGNHYLQVKKGINCYFDTTVVITKQPDQPACKDIFIPTAFTPNNDGRNEIFKPSDLSYMNNITMRIFNRWGQTVYQGYGPGISWDGNYMGQKQPAGVYVYTLQYKMITGEIKFRKGTITLLR